MSSMMILGIVAQGARSPSVPSIRQVNGVTASSSTAVIPITGAQAGDFVLLLCSGGWAPSQPAGWFASAAQLGTNWNAQAYHKVVTAADVAAGSVTITWSGNFALMMHAVIFDGPAIPSVAAQARQSAMPSNIMTLNLPVENDQIVILHTSHRANTVEESIISNKGVPLRFDTRADASGRTWQYNQSGDSTETFTFQYPNFGMGAWQFAQAFKRRIPLQSPSYSSPFGTGNRNSIIRVTNQNISIANSPPNQWVNGVLNDQVSFFANGTNTGVETVTFEFLDDVRIDGFRWIQSSTTAHGLWNFEASADGSTWEVVYENFTLGGNLITTYEFTNNLSRRFYRLRAMSGSRGNNPWIHEIEFRSN